MRLLWIFVLAAAGCAPSAGQSVTVSSSPAHPREFTVAEPLPNFGGTATAELLLPPGADGTRGVLVFINRGLDEYAYDNREWRAMCARARCAMLRLTLPRDDGPPAAQRVRNAELGGGQMLLSLLRRLAEESGHAEIADASLVLWGFSAAGSFGPTFAQWRPDRTLGFVRYHSNMRGIATDIATLSRIPALILAGELDQVAGTEDSERFWAAGRHRGAPWAFAVHPGRGHRSVDGLLEASPLMRSWVEGLLRQHQRTSSAGADSVRRSWREETGWVAHHTTGEVMPVPSYRGERGGTSWFPDKASAVAWHALRGPCAAVPLVLAAELLGPAARKVGTSNDFCHYVAPGVSGDTSSLVLAVRGLRTSGKAQEMFRDMAERSGGTPLPDLADDAFTAASADRQCAVVALRHENFIYEASLCRPDATATDRLRMAERLARRSTGQSIR